MQASRRCLVKCYGYKKGTLISKVATRDPSGKDYMLNRAAQSSGLFVTNFMNNNLNDAYIHNVFTKYKLFDKLVEEP